MDVWLLLIAAVGFSYLAVDAYSMGRSSRHQPYEIEAMTRGENVPIAATHKKAELTFIFEFGTRQRSFEDRIATFASADS